MFIRRRLSLSRVALVGLLAAALVPLHAMPVAAATAATLKPGNPAKSAPLGTGKAKTLTPQVPSGDFRNAPKSDAVVSSVSQEKRDHFDPQTSKLITRTATSNIWTNADGTKSIDEYGSPINYQDSQGNFQPINDALEPSTDAKTIHNTAGPVDFGLEAKPTASKIATLNVNGKTVSFGLDRFAANENAIVSHDTTDIAKDVVTYPGAIDGGDLQYAMIGTRLKESIILHSAPATAPTYHFPLSFNGLHAVTKSDGTIAFDDANNTDVITVDPPTMWDASNSSQRIPVAMTLSADGKALDLTPDFTWLSDPARVFPLTIDPTYDGAGYNSVYYMDTFTNTAYPNNNYNAFYQYGAYTNQVGYDNYPGSQNYGYLYEDVTALNGKQILNGSLKMLEFGTSSTAAVHIHPVAPSFWNGATLTWNNQPNHLSDQILTVPVSNAWTNIDMTTWVQNWTNGTWQNSGIEMDTAGVNAYYRLSAIENGTGYQPYIHVTYNDLPPAATLIAPNDGDQVLSPTPTLSANAVTPTVTP